MEMELEKNEWLDYTDKYQRPFLRHAQTRSFVE
jgi:hypothetical protein